jgi:hypothetical protein
MKALFDWLVRHERSVAALLLLLLVALFVQLKFFRRPGESKTGTVAVGARLRAADSTPAATESVAGRWEMQVQKRKGGAQTWTLTLEQSGEALQGVIKSEGGDLPVNGSVRGSALKLSARRYGVNVEFDATVEGDTLRGRMKVLTIDRAWTAKRL